MFICHFTVERLNMQQFEMQVLDRGFLVSTVGFIVPVRAYLTNKMVEAFAGYAFELCKP